MSSHPQEIIDYYELRPHPEGGYFERVYESDILIPEKSLPYGYEGERFAATTILYFLEHPDFSRFHKIRQDESWHFHMGGTLLIHELTPSGEYIEHRLGTNFHKQEKVFLTIKGGSYFAAEPIDGWTLVSCSVCPGFDFKDFRMPASDILIREFPQHKQIIERLGYTL